MIGRASTQGGLHMKRSSLVTALMAGTLAAAFGGCAQYAATGYQPHYQASSSSRPVVLVEDGGSGLPTIRVSPRTLIFSPDQKHVEIIWTIPKAQAGGKQFTFVPGTGIDFRGELKFKVERVGGSRDAKAAAAASAGDLTFLDPKQDQITNCEILAGGLQFRCLNRNMRPGLFKYAVQVTDGKDSFVIDPLLENW
jgi:hypothetical protein